MTAHHEKPRGVQERIHISGKLTLETPAHFGNGQVRGDALVDMMLLLDEAEPGKALIPGTSVAGALRNYLRERLCGYFEAEDGTDWDSKIAWLFGPARESSDDLDQSLLIVDDALASAQGTTLRDGVRINPKTGTAWVAKTDAAGQVRKEGAKFDIEFLEPDTAFDLHFELALTEDKGAEVLPYLVAALQGLENGDIRLGARKRRGYGRCRVDGWLVSRYRLTDPGDLCAWLETPAHAHRPNTKPADIATALGVGPAAEDQRKRCTIQATFALERSSVLIRSGFGQADVGPDMEHLHSRDKRGKPQPVISGTSWAGVIRHRGLRIANTLAGDDEEAQLRAVDLVNALFGWMPAGEQGGRASKLTVDETTINDGQSLYQTRVRIDRFTGGAFETALFEQAPVYGKRNTRVGFRLDVREPEPYEMGLLLLVLKDLWTGDLPVGGEASVGRGRLQGVEATLTTPAAGAFTLSQGQPALGLDASQQAVLQGYVTALGDKLAGKQEVHNG